MFFCKIQKCAYLCGVFNNEIMQITDPNTHPILLAAINEMLSDTDFQPGTEDIVQDDIDKYTRALEDQAEATERANKALTAIKNSIHHYKIK